MTVSAHTLILIAVFVYFGIGAAVSISLTAFSLGFGGRFEPMAIVLFFFWPFFYLIQIPYLMFVLIGLGVAGGMTWLAHALLS